MKKIYVVVRQWHGSDVWGAFENAEEAQNFIDKENARSKLESSYEEFYLHETTLQGGHSES